MADVAADACRKAEGKTTSVISPLALEAVRRIDALFEIERTINGESAERRRTLRQELSAPFVTDLETLVAGTAAPSGFGFGEDSVTAFTESLASW